MGEIPGVENETRRIDMDPEIKKQLDRIERLTLLGAKTVLSVQDVAFLLGKSEKTVRNNISEIPHYRNGHGIWFKRDEIEAWQCQVRCTPVSQLMSN